MDMSAIQNFELRKFTLTPESPVQQPPQMQQVSGTLDQQQQQTAEQLKQQMAVFKTQTVDAVPPRVHEYSPHFGPEGQTFTVTLQSNTDKTLRIGFVPLYVLQMENDMVMHSWPFGDYNYYDADNSQATNSNKRASVSVDKLLYDQNTESPVANKKQHLLPELDLTRTQINHQQLSQPASPSTPLSLTGNNDLPRHDDYSGLSTSTTYDAGLYSQNLQPSSPYGSRTPMSTSTYARTGYYNSNQMIAPHIPTYSQADLGANSTYALTTTAAGHNTNYIHSHHPQPVAPSSYMPQPHPSTSLSAGLPLSSYNPYASLLNKANLKFTGNMDDMAINWSAEEWESHRRLVQFWRRQDGNDIHCTFAPVAPADRQPNSIVVSCIYWAEKNDCFLTSVDCIYLLESLIAVRFTVEEKNRIRRNLEGFRPITVSKCKPESAEFFKLIMSFPNPKPRNIEKDVKVFPWKVLPYALKKIISKYTASYSSTASIQTDAFHNANFPHGSTLPMTPQQQSIIESSSILV
ncbi:hypothetical protein BGZ76_009811 [Entomortierella beljakovae]|nr:hypothetical protein BGZ76_009811 [Entomortierella beljakovae]